MPEEAELKEPPERPAVKSGYHCLSWMHRQGHRVVVALPAGEVLADSQRAQFDSLVTDMRVDQPSEMHFTLGREAAPEPQGAQYRNPGRIQSRRPLSAYWFADAGPPQLAAGDLLYVHEDPTLRAVTHAAAVAGELSPTELLSAIGAQLHRLAYNLAGVVDEHHVGRELAALVVPDVPAAALATRDAAPALMTADGVPELAQSVSYGAWTFYVGLIDHAWITVLQPAELPYPVLVRHSSVYPRSFA